MQHTRSGQSPFCSRYHSIVLLAGMACVAVLLAPMRSSAASVSEGTSVSLQVVASSSSSSSEEAEDESGQDEQPAIGAGNGGYRYSRDRILSYLRLRGRSASSSSSSRSSVPSGVARHRSARDRSGLPTLGGRGVSRRWEIIWPGGPLPTYGRAGLHAAASTLRVVPKSELFLWFGIALWGVISVRTAYASVRWMVGRWYR